MDDDFCIYMKPGAPRYRLTESAYIDDQLLEPGAEISYEGIPGHHMDPLDDVAREMKRKHPSNYVDPIVEMTSILAAAQREGSA